MCLLNDRANILVTFINPAGDLAVLADTQNVSNMITVYKSLETEGSVLDVNMCPFGRCHSEPLPHEQCVSKKKETASPTCGHSLRPFDFAVHC